MKNILSLERLQNIKLADILSPKITRFVWKTHEPNICPLCASLDGKVMDATDPDYSIYQQPLHPNCKCTWGFITSDAEKIPKVDWERPKEEWIKKYAPFLFIIPFKGKKGGPIEISPYAPEAPELVFNIKDVLSIEEYIRETELRNIENAKQRMSIMEKENMRIFYIVFFLNKLGQTILMKETEKDTEIDFTNREEAQIRKEAISYLISESNDLVENQIENMFNIKKR